jgi:hypothetical protein
MTVYASRGEINDSCEKDDIPRLYPSLARE